MRIFYSIGKTPHEDVKNCNDRSKMDQKSYGAFVMLTAIFAFISGLYALTSIFGEWDPVLNQYVMSTQMRVTTIVVAFFYALMIGMIDREIVAARSKLAVLLRIPLALIVGIVVAVPLKLKILEDSIHQQIYENQASRMIPMVEQRNQIITAIDHEISDIEEQIAAYVYLRNLARTRAEDEEFGRVGDRLTGEIGRGRAYRHAREEQDSHQNEINRLEQLRLERIQYRDRRVQELQVDFQYYETEAVFGLWEKYLVMHQIVNEDETGKARIMVYGLSLLFILFELIPSLIKLLNPKNDYDMMLDLRDFLVKKKINQIMNDQNHNSKYSDLIELPEIRIKNHQNHNGRHIKTNQSQFLS